MIKITVEGEMKRNQGINGTRLEIKTCTAQEIFYAMISLAEALGKKAGETTQEVLEDAKQISKGIVSVDGDLSSGNIDKQAIIQKVMDEIDKL